MVGDVKGERRYRSPLRVEQAAETRRRILVASRELFLRRGYTGTTVAAVAAAAGVSPDTIYGSLGGKKGLLEGVLSAAISDPGDPGQDEQRRRHGELDLLADPERRLRRMIEHSCATLARTSPVQAIMRGAADSDEFTSELKATMLKRRLDNQARSVRTYLGTALRPGLTPDDAAQRYSALASPELYHLLTVDMDWSPERYQSWLIDVLTADLLSR